MIPFIEYLKSVSFQNTVTHPLSGKTDYYSLNNTENLKLAHTDGCISVVFGIVKNPVIENGIGDFYNMILHVINTLRIVSLSVRNFLITTIIHNCLITC